MSQIVENGQSICFIGVAKNMKILAIIIFLVIIASLASALYQLIKNPNAEGSAKLVKALTVRISLSVLLFIIVFIAYATGLFQPQGIGARIEQYRLEHASNQAGEPAQPGK